MLLPLVLASSSRYRAELLQRLQLPFSLHSPDIDETPLPGETPVSLCRRLAVAKANALRHLYPEHLLIGSDQVADCHGDIIGKPGTEENAVRQLTRFSGHAVDFHTGLALLNSRTGTLQRDVVSFRVWFRALDDAAIRRYIALDRPLDCAGSFRCEGLGISLFERMEGQDPTSLIGLPLISLAGMLRTEGYLVP